MPPVLTLRPPTARALRGLLLAMMIVVATAIPVVGAQEEGEGFDPDAYFSTMRRRHIGPTRGGRAVAVAGGVPVVACAASAHPVVDGETGYVVEDGNAEQMVERCAALLDDHGLRRKMGTAARLRSMEIYEQRVMIEPIIEKVLA